MRSPELHRWGVSPEEGHRGCAGLLHQVPPARADPPGASVSERDPQKRGQRGETQLAAFSF